QGFPINVLNQIKLLQEVCGIYCATANPVEVLVAQTEGGRGIVGVIDGAPPLGGEQAEHVEERKRLLRKLGYKLGRGLKPPLSFSPTLARAPQLPGANPSGAQPALDWPRPGERCGPPRATQPATPRRGTPYHRPW